MANINEEDEKSEYSDEQFEEEEVQKVQTKEVGQVHHEARASLLRLTHH